ncbi:MAG: type IX secretion system membrane protein PorP/SprF [Bacteroidetes bacterium]|nr:MAG: type IX secretion system membrane protein PorP/SprF [Bacteroidota bacterium]
MSRPDFENIDLWLFEYAEGNLSPEQIEQLKMFLFLHPELDVELDAWKAAKVSPVNTDYPHTEALIKEPSYVGLKLSAALTVLIVLFLFLLPNTIDEAGIKFAASNGTSEEDQLLKVESDNAYEATALKNRLRELENQVATLEAENQRLRVDAAVASNVETSRSSSSSFESNLTEMAVSSESGTSNYFEPKNSDKSTNVGVEMNTEASVTESFYAETEENNIDTRPAEVIDWYASPTPVGVHANEHSASSSDYKRSFSDKLRTLGRTIQRMMDNPIALKNSRDPQYGLPGMTAQDINFSAVGGLLTTRVQTLSRVQFLGTEQEQYMNTVNIDGYSYAIRGGLGMQMYHSTFHNGGIQHGGIALTYAPKFSVNRYFSIEPSVRFKMGAKLLDYNRVSGLETVEMQPGINYDFYPEGQQPIGRQLWYKDLGLGLMVNTKWFFAGINADNVFRHQDNIYNNSWNQQRRTSVNFTATIGTDWENNRENLRLSPYVVMNVFEGREMLYAGANLQWNWFTFGAAVSSQAEPIASIGMKFKQFTLSYTADYSKSIAMDKSLLSHQLSLRINGKTSRFGRRLSNL